MQLLMGSALLRIHDPVQLQRNSNNYYRVFGVFVGVAWGDFTCLNGLLALHVLHKKRQASSTCCPEPDLFDIRAK
jgi:hypothetical protein